jgi:isoquinoline 1-oxidoreductase alpha subunit
MISLTVNGKNYNVDAPKDISLLWVLRDYLKLTGTKYGCGIGECGSCTVLIEGPEDHPVKRAWIQEQVVQCGYCQTGVIMQVAGLLSENKNPDANEIMDSMDDVICRCGTYHRMKRGIKTAVEIARKEG